MPRVSRPLPERSLKCPRSRRRDQVRERADFVLAKDNRRGDLLMKISFAQTACCFSSSSGRFEKLCQTGERMAIRQISSNDGGAYKEPGRQVYRPLQPIGGLQTTISAQQHSGLLHVLCRLQLFFGKVSRCRTSLIRRLKTSYTRRTPALSSSTVRPIGDLGLYSR